MSGLDTIRTDVVGSLLRPDSVKKARADWDAGKIDLAERTRIEDNDDVQNVYANFEVSDDALAKFAA